MLALTFDDGPHPVCTPQLLDILARHGATATFFPMAARAAAHPEIVARMLADGHTVGLHCLEHVRHSTRDHAWLSHDTETALDLLGRVGVTPRLWRPPYGDVAPWTAQVARDHKLELTLWSADTVDWNGRCAETMFADTRDLLQDGAIVLAHDGIGPGRHRPDTSETLRFVELAATHAASQHITLSGL